MTRFLVRDGRIVAAVSRCERLDCFAFSKGNPKVDMTANHGEGQTQATQKYHLSNEETVPIGGNTISPPGMQHLLFVDRVVDANLDPPNDTPPSIAFIA